MTVQADTPGMTGKIIPHAEPMSALDRCDRCGAQAYVRVILGAGDVLLCAHHTDQHNDKICEQALEIHDHRPALNAQEQGKVATT